MNVSLFFKTYLFTYKIPTLVGRPRTSEPLSPPPPEFKNGVVEMAPRLGKCAGQVLPTKLHPQSFCFSSWDRATLELKYSSLLSLLGLRECSTTAQLYFYVVRMSVSSACMYVHHVHAMPREAQRGYQIPQDWSTVVVSCCVDTGSLFQGGCSHFTF